MKHRLQRASGRTAATAVRYASTGPVRQKILIVDDEPELVRALTVRFRAAGYATVSAADAAGARWTAVLERPDLVLLDIGLPDGDGYEVLAALQSETRTAKIPIVFLTARPRNADRAQALTPDGYVLKPYQSDTLMQLVAQLTGTVGNHLSAAPTSAA